MYSCVCLLLLNTVWGLFMLLLVTGHLHGWKVFPCVLYTIVHPSYYWRTFGLFPFLKIVIIMLPWAFCTGVSVESVSRVQSWGVCIHGVVNPKWLNQAVHGIPRCFRSTGLLFWGPAAGNWNRSDVEHGGERPKPRESHLCGFSAVLHKLLHESHYWELNEKLSWMNEWMKQIH
jgi:hypothetical protein